MNSSNATIFAILQKCYSELKQQSDLFEEKRSKFEILKREVELAQSRLQQTEAVTSSLITQAIEESLYSGAIQAQITSIAGRFPNNFLMLQAVPATDTVWFVSVMVADLFQKVEVPADRAIKIWVYDPKQRLGSQYDLKETFLRVGGEIPGINVEHGIQLQFVVDILTGYVVTQANYVTPFQLPTPPTASAEVEPVVEGEVVTDDLTGVAEETLSPQDTPGGSDEDQH